MRQKDLNVNLFTIPGGFQLATPSHERVILSVAKEPGLEKLEVQFLAFFKACGPGSFATLLMTRVVIPYRSLPLAASWPQDDTLWGWQATK